MREQIGPAHYLWTVWSNHGNIMWTTRSIDSEDSTMTQTAYARMPVAKRRALVLAAGREFASHSFEQASLNRIIADCHMSKSSFYHVIDSKESLLTLVVRELRDDAAHDWTPPEPADFAPDFWATADLVFHDALRIWPDSRALGLLWRIVHANRGDPAVTSLGSSFESWVAAALDVGRQTGAVDSACPAELQVLAATTLLTAFDEWALARTQSDNGDGQNGGDLEAAADDQFRLLRRLLEA